MGGAIGRRLIATMSPRHVVELTIVMPCLNEAETLETCITKARSFLNRSGITGEIVIGDNGSADGSIEIARRCGARVVNIPIRGYGAASTAPSSPAENIASWAIPTTAMILANSICL